MKMMKKISIIIMIFMCAFVIAPQKSDAALFDTGTIMNGANSFLNNAENREIFNSDSERSAVDQIYFTMLTIGIVLATSLYGYYVNYIANYNYIYGNLANIIVLMILIYDIFPKTTNKVFQK